MRGKSINRLVATAFVAVAAIASSVPAFAGLPRDVVLKANDKDGDPMIGISVARGDAELVAKARKIIGRADVIEVWAKSNKVYFRGNATVNVGDETYTSETVECTLDFYSCASMDSSKVSSVAGTATTSPQ